MKTCDRCLPKFVPVTETFIMSMEGTQIDLCEKCKNEVLAFIHKPPEKKRGILSLGKRKKDSEHANL